MPSDPICDSYAKFDDIMAISALVSAHCGHSIRLFQDFNLWPGQVMTHNAT